MCSIETPLKESSIRRDLPLEEAFCEATDNVIVAPNTLQQALFPRLSTQDTGLLVQTGPGAGRLEAVFVPVMTGSISDDCLHRLFVIAPDNTLLDDYVYRLARYMSAIATARGSATTLFVEGSEAFCRKFLPDGSYVDDTCNHPLDVCVDLVVAPFSAFMSLFFGAGGVHAIPGKLETGDGDNALDVRRRDLFYFDEAQGYQADDFRSFVRLIEFLYAEDLDVMIGTTTLPDGCRDDLAFLELLSIDNALSQPPRTIVSVPCEARQVEDIMIQLVRERYLEGARVAVVRETAIDVNSAAVRLSTLFPGNFYSYHSGQSSLERRGIYSQLRKLEKEGSGYLIVCDGAAIEGADLDVKLMLTSVCAPELLLRRAGRCNRRGLLANGEIVVVGDAYTGRPLPSIAASGYKEALNAMVQQTEFLPDVWRKLIV